MVTHSHVSPVLIEPLWALLFSTVQSLLSWSSHHGWPVYSVAWDHDELCCWHASSPLPLVSGAGSPTITEWERICENELFVYVCVCVCVCVCMCVYVSACVSDPLCVVSACVCACVPLVTTLYVSLTQLVICVYHSCDPVWHLLNRVHSGLTNPETPVSDPKWPKFDLQSLITVERFKISS